MAFKYNYQDTDNPVRTIAAPDPVPTRGSVLAAAPPGTIPDFTAKQFQGMKLCFLTDDAVAGTVTFTLWARDMVEFGDANNRTPNPPDPTKVMWVRMVIGVTVDHLEEYIFPDVNKRGIYVQLTAFGGAAASADLFIAPYESAQPYTSI